MIDVQQGALRALQQDRLAALERLIELQAGIGDAVLESLGLFEHPIDNLIRVQRLAVVDLDQHLVLEFQCGMHLLAQRFLVQDVGDPDPDARHLVLIAGPDTTAGGANLLGSQISFGHLVDRDVVRHQQMRIRGQDEARGVDPRSSRPASSVSSTPGSTTTPLPMTFVTPG
ncbi:hypothetical protein L829_0004 [Mycobacteroides abscessus MAB_030201_1075]|uniref:Uncharacterized protein n=1 Tax=Mycobacteroides abscessus MAB_030201_1075 TaxID=1335410 RepID=A0A829PJF4_9MYCO|nr:hypothetical protein L829_0004 [Mycobacteroides abscessus MAB_030201_1075]